MEWFILIIPTIAFIWAMWTIISHKSKFPTLMAGTSGYAWSAVWTTRFHSIFKCDKRSDAYKFKHNDLMFVRPTQAKEGMWERGDWLICNTVDDSDFEPGAYYLFEQDKQYRIARCEAGSRGLPPIFNGSETLITHHCIGRIFGVMDNRFEMRMLKVLG